MLIFVYEFVTARSVGDNSLRREGRAMLDAVLSDLAHCPGVRTLTLPAVTAEEEQSAFVERAGNADFTLVIAPEFDDLLFERCCWVEECGGRSLGSTPVAVRLTGDKARLAQHLQARGIPTPATLSSPSASAFPLVCKPRFGAGSQATFLIRNSDELDTVASRARAEGWHGEMIVQPYCAGHAASVAVLAGRDLTLTLPACAQHLSTDGRFRYLGGALPLHNSLNARAQRLARQAVEAVEGLFGYSGVDVVLGAVADGRDDMVIEINPRLTTSYVGLRRLACFNLAEALLAVATGTPLPDIAWNEGAVTFRAEGTVFKAARGSASWG